MRPDAFVVDVAGLSLLEVLVELWRVELGVRLVYRVCHGFDGCVRQPVGWSLLTSPRPQVAELVLEHHPVQYRLGWINLAAERHG